MRVGLRSRDASKNDLMKIAITTGDVDGIGTEVAARALQKLGPAKNVRFYFWRSPRCPSRHLAWLDRRFKRVTVNGWPEALQVNTDSHRQLIDICSNMPPALWFETSVQAALFGHVDAIATGPLSKTSIVAAGLNDLGHTGILKRLTKKKELFMGFVGKHFNVVLATDHVALSEVEGLLTAPKLKSAIRAADQLRSMLKAKTSELPIAVLGLNPHSGENGLIGQTEQRIHKATIDALLEDGMSIEGPLVPDAAFFKRNWPRYSVFVANYHDQGLIPFKMIHGQESGIHVTLGLPFVRTSVDHGTAKDLFGLNKADPTSMKLAIEWAIKLSSRRK